MKSYIQIGHFSLAKGNLVIFKTIIISCLLLLIACSNPSSQEESTDETAHGEKNHSYYTCSMHPQIHDHKMGSCPMCGMPLIKVSSNGEAGESKNHLLPTDYQKNVMGFTQGEVEFKEVTFELPVGGRLISGHQVAFSIYESDILKVKLGLEFEGECSAMRGDVLKGKITHIDTIADPASRSVRVIGNITSAHNMKLIEGSFFGRILFPPTKSLLIPYEAVLRTGKDNIVYVVKDDGSLDPTSVVVGRTHGEEIEILSGLSEGESISFGPNFLIDSEARLKGF